ncbi:MAG: Ig domain-containing protein, partial [Gemmataceae bacterium]|nr:Ig domain-containing protein [Gemmataceae bacterium]
QLAASDADGDPVSFVVTGLPAGLSADSAGLITGTIDFDAAQTNGGGYTVTVAATDGKGGSASVTFNWTVADMPQLPVAVPDTYNRGRPVRDRQRASRQTGQDG